MGLQTEFLMKENILVVRLKGELDHHEATKLREKWQHYLNNADIANVILNLEEMTFMDSSGIGVILGRYKEIIALGGELVVCHVNSHIEKILSMSGLFKIIRIEENEQQALLSMGVAS